MKLSYVALFLVASSISACEHGSTSKNGGADNKSDTLTYTYTTFKKRADDCGSKPDSSCTVMACTYPVFNNRQKLNDSIKSRLSTTFSVSENPDTSLTALSKKLLTEYQVSKKDQKGDVDRFYLDNDCKILKQDSGLVTLQISGDCYLGGAHGSAFTSYINWDTKTDKVIKLSDLLIAGYQEKLTTAGEHIFRKNEKLADTASLADSYFFKDSQFALNDNFLVTSSGLRFFYNEYEIKSYAEGPTELFIPYTQIKSLLRPNTVVAQYIK